MRAPSEIGTRAVALVHLATDQSAEFIGPSRGDDEAVGDLLFEAGKAVPKSGGRHATRQIWEEHGPATSSWPWGTSFAPRRTTRARRIRRKTGGTL